MFNPDFYPTPPEVAAEMLDPLDLRGRTVLEPSAGSGNLVRECLAEVAAQGCGMTTWYPPAAGTGGFLFTNPPFKMTEHDPTGRSAHEPGAKLDAGKPRCGLVLGSFSRALVQVAQVGTYGAAKYTDNGWRSVPHGQERYTDALWRHLLAEAQGLECDPDSGLLHAAHTAWNALARLELLLAAEEQADG